MKKKLWLTGASGLLGGNILREAAASEAFDLLATQHDSAFTIPKRFTRGTEVEPLDLLSHTEVWNLFSLWRPDVIIHAAALTDAAYAEAHPDEATALNFTATRVLTDLCAQFNAKLIFISTDLVFDGLQGNYAETDAPNPLSHYGRTKAQAESVVLENLPAAAVLRTSLLLGSSPRGTRSINEKLLEAYRAGSSFIFFSDEYRSPIDAQTLASIALEFATHDAAGLFHAGGSERLSRYDLGSMLCTHFSIDASHIRAAKLSDASLVPPRPADCSMNNTKLCSIIRTPIPSVAEMIAAL